MVPNLILQSHQVSIEMEPPSKEASSALAIAAPALSSADGGVDADRRPTDAGNDGFMGGSGVDVRQTQHTTPTLCSSNNGFRSKEVVK